MRRASGSAGSGRRAGRRARRRVATSFAVALALLTATAAGAGATGESWPIPRARLAPAIDGVADPVWADAVPIHIGLDFYAIDLRALHDGRTFYLLIQNHTDVALDAGDRFSLTFEDEGGSQSHLWGGSWSNSVCDEEGDEGEGRLEVEGFGEDVNFFGHLVDLSVCGGKSQAAAIPAALVQDDPTGGGVTAELAIPIDGPTALEALAGFDFGSYLTVVDEIDGTEFVVGEWPAGGSIPDFANASLATLGCNAGSEDFDPWLGVDWQRSHAAGAVDWILTGGGGCTVPNYTSGAGRAICLEYGGTDAVAAYLDSQAVSLIGASAGELRFRLNFQHSPGTRFGVLGSADGGLTWSETLLDWHSSDLGEATGPGVVVSLPVPAAMLGEPDARFRVFFQAEPGSAAAFAQVDDLELTCGPLLFADGFESGLTTHWGATAPYP